MPRLTFPAVLLVLFWASHPTSSCAADGEPVRFGNEVMAVLSRGGCNQGACHGNQNGKNGFRLSLRGDDPAFDFASLTRDMQGRRVDRQRPEESLLLQKAVALMPHEGGKRFGVDSLEYRVLRSWIAAGCPPDPVSAPTLCRLDVTPTEVILAEPASSVRLHVQATFSDGSVRDVSRLAVYELSNQVATVSPDGEVCKQERGETTILVRYLDRRVPVQVAFIPSRPGYHGPGLPERNFVDHYVFAKLQALRLRPSDLCPDNVFLRRVYLDTIGVLPTADEARSFLADADPHKREKVVDALLLRPEFADFWALKWSDVLRNEEKVLDRKGVQVFHQWIRQWIAEGKPLNEFARALVSARGSTYDNPPANYYRALRDPQERAEATAQVFLGVRIQCARCHNHPFDRWTQDDYHSLAAFFARVDYRILANNRRDKFDKHEFDGEQIVLATRTGEIKHPRTGVTLRPRFLGSSQTLPEDADRLQAFADWVARPDNPFFARAQVNRIWYHLMGRGLIEPNDDFRASNPPANGPLLDALAHDFVTHGFDLRHTVRTILTSSTYQLSAVPNETNRDDEANCSHALVRPLQAEVLLDAVSAALGAPVHFTGYPAGTRACQLAGVRAVRQRDQRPSAGDDFLQRFGKPERLLSCECERSDDTTVVQAFQLVTGELINGLLTRTDNRIGRLLSSGRPPEALVRELYLASLSRYPTAEELHAAVGLLARAKDRRAACEDLAWALLNSKEFLLRR